MTAAELPVAEARVAVARERLGETAALLRTTIDPRPRVRAHVDRIAEQGAMAVDTGIAAARRHPRAATGIAALFVAILARKRIARIFTRLGGEPAETTQPQIVQGVRSDKAGPRPVKGNER